MTNDDIEMIIGWINEGKASQVYHRKWSHQYGQGIAWPRMPEDQTSRGYHFYFVFSEAKCVAAVLDMEDDLHAFTQPQHRRKGIMRRALVDYVLPCLSAKGRSHQRVSFKDQQLEALLNGCGFEVTRRPDSTGDSFLPGEASIDLRSDSGHGLRTPRPVRISEDRLANARKDLEHAARLISRVHDEALVALGQRSILENLMGCAEQARRLGLDLEDASWDIPA